MQLHLLIFTFIQILGIRCLIVPDEIPTILSVIYSNIPVIKKGTDSRIGWGFRLGNRADFQVLTELGPQTYTQPLANQQDKNTNNKRNTLDTLSNTLYAQRLKDKQNKENRQKEIKKNEENEKISDSDGGKWLQSWSKSVRQRTSPPPKQEVPPGAKPGLAVGEIDAKSVIPDDDTMKLIQMYLKKLAEATTEKNQNEGLKGSQVENSGLKKLTELYATETTTKESESVTESTTAQKLE